MRQASTVESFYALQPAQYSVLRRLELKQSTEASHAQLAMEVELVDRRDARGLLTLTFTHVTDLKIDWPEWSLVQADVIDIKDVSDQGLEAQRFRVYEGSGLFRLSCGGFRARIS